MSRLIDLSFPLEHGQLNFPSDPKISVIVHNTVSTIGYNITQFSMGTHHGTHLDAPFHFFEDGKTVDQIPLDRFFGPALLMDLAPGSHLAAKTPITPAMFEPYSDRIQAGAKVIYRTGWDREFGTHEYFADFPSLTVEAAEWLAERRIGLLGMDTPTPGTQWKEVHWILLARAWRLSSSRASLNLISSRSDLRFPLFP